MKKTQILLRKTIEGNSNRRLRVGVRVRFLLFYSELVPTDPWCNMLCDFTWTEKIWGGNVRWTPSQWRYFIERPVFWFVGWIKWLGFTWNATLGWSDRTFIFRTFFVSKKSVIHKIIIYITYISKNSKLCVC